MWCLSCISCSRTEVYMILSFLHHIYAMCVCHWTYMNNLESKSVKDTCGSGLLYHPPTRVTVPRRGTMGCLVILKPSTHIHKSLLPYIKGNLYLLSSLLPYSWSWCDVCPALGVGYYILVGLIVSVLHHYFSIHMDDSIWSHTYSH